MDVAITLDRLESAQLVRRLEETGLWYLFKHTLTQESVYESLLKTRRTELHRRVAEALESICGQEVEPSAAMLAMHYERAGIDDKAFRYLALAGDVAARSYAHQEALMLYDRALAVARRTADPSWNPRIREIFASRGRVLEVNGNHPAALENYQDMIAFAQKVGDIAMEADALTHLLTTQGTLGNVPDADNQLMRALDLARQSGDAALIGRALWNLGLAIRFKEPNRAIDYFFQALEHARAAGLRELEGYILADIGSEMGMTGRWHQSLDFGKQTLSIFRELDNKPMIANAYGNLGDAYFSSGDADLARQAAAEGSRISKAIENPWGIGYNEWVILALNLDAGEFDECLERGAKVLEIARVLGFSLFEAMANTILSRLYAEANQVERADALAELAVQQFSSMGSSLWSGLGAGMSAHAKIAAGRLEDARNLLLPYAQPHTLETENLWILSFAGLALAELALAEGDYARAKGIADVLVPRMEEEHLNRYSVELLYIRSKAEHALGQFDLATQDLDHAAELALRGRNNILLWRIHAELAAIAEENGATKRAADELDRANKIIAEITLHISDPVLHQSFLERADVRQITGKLYPITIAQ